MYFHISCLFSNSTRPPCIEEKVCENETLEKGSNRSIIDYGKAMKNRYFMCWFGIEMRDECVTKVT